MDRDLVWGEIPQKTDDELRNREIESLTKLKGQIEAGDVCCVIIEYAE